MARKMIIPRIIRDEHWQEFNALLLHFRNISVDAARAWLSERGYKVSRHAIWNYRKALVHGELWGIDERKEGRFTERHDLEGTKLLTFNLPGACFNVQVADAVVDIQERRTGFVISIRRGSAVAGKTDATRVATEVKKTGGDGKSNAP